eukprot:1158027-Pelagomonas_calceolata.AAC.2
MSCKICVFASAGGISSRGDDLTLCRTKPIPALRLPRPAASPHSFADQQKPFLHCPSCSRCWFLPAAAAAALAISAPVAAAPVKAVPATLDPLTAAPAPAAATVVTAAENAAAVASASAAAAGVDRPLATHPVALTLPR